MALLTDPTLILLNDHGLMRDGIERQLLIDFPAATIAYSGDSLQEALAVTASTSVDCAVVDLDLRDETPVAETVSAFTVRRIAVVVISAIARPDVLQAVIAAGASAFVAKRSSLRSLTTAVRTVLDGGTWIPPDLVGSALHTTSSVELSVQEKRALVLYASGLTLDMVARRMEITPNTVKYYLDRVRDKYTEAGISARTKVQLNQVARAHGLIP